MICSFFPHSLLILFCLFQRLSMEQSDGLAFCLYAPFWKCGGEFRWKNVTLPGLVVGGGEHSPRLQQRPALSLNFLSIFMWRSSHCPLWHPASIVSLCPQFYQLQSVSHPGCCTNNDYHHCCQAEFKLCPYANAPTRCQHAADLLRSCTFRLKLNSPSLCNLSTRQIISNPFV